MKLLFLPSALLVLLASCGPNKHVNSWDRQSSALDPVGITSKKMAAKKQGGAGILQAWGSRYVQEGQNDGVRAESGNNFPRAEPSGVG